MKWDPCDDPGAELEGQTQPEEPCRFKVVKGKRRVAQDPGDPLLMKVVRVANTRRNEATANFEQRRTYPGIHMTKFAEKGRGGENESNIRYPDEREADISGYRYDGGRGEGTGIK